jgi:hypothetical protein
MQHRENVHARREKRKPRAVTEWDSLLGVHDQTRLGVRTAELQTPLTDVRTLLEGRDAGLQPGEDEVSDPGEYSCHQSNQGSNPKTDDLEPEFRPQLSGLCVGDVA